MRRVSLFLLPLLGLLASSCATSPLPLGELSEGEVAEASVVFFSLRLENQRSSWQLRPTYLELIENSGKSRTITFSQPIEVRSSERKPYGEYLLPLVLPAGDYRLIKLVGYSGPAAERSRFVLPLDAIVNLSAGEKVYTGHLLATVVDRELGEPSAGSVQANIPLDVTGVSGGKFETRVSNRFSEDLELLKEEYPSLSNLKWSKRLLVPKAGAKPIRKGGAVRSATETSVKDSAEPPEVKSSSVELRPIAPAERSRCSVHQVLKMKDLGLDESQIRKACE